METEESLAAETTAFQTLLSKALTCSAKGCETVLEGGQWFCPDHWKKVPKGFKHQMLEHYEVGQDKPDGIPNKEFMVAVESAILAVEKEEAIVQEAMKV